MKVLLIGRDPQCDILVSDNSISRKHAQLVQTDDGKVSIMDLGSVNGIYINGKLQPKDTACNLLPDDVVHLANFPLPWKDYVDVKLIPNQNTIPNTSIEEPVDNTPTVEIDNVETESDSSDVEESVESPTKNEEGNIPVSEDEHIEKTPSSNLRILMMLIGILLLLLAFVILFLHIRDNRNQRYVENQLRELAAQKDSLTQLQKELAENQEKLCQYQAQLKQDSINYEKTKSERDSLKLVKSRQNVKKQQNIVQKTAAKKEAVAQEVKEKQNTIKDVMEKPTATSNDNSDNSNPKKDSSATPNKTTNNSSNPGVTTNNSTDTSQVATIATTSSKAESNKNNRKGKGKK